MDRLALLRFARQERERLEIDPFGANESSYVLEDAFREFAPPDKQYLADYLRKQRGYFGERGVLDHMIEWLDRLPFHEAVERTRKRIEKTLSSAWNRGVIDRNDERRIPFLTFSTERIESLLDSIGHWSVSTLSWNLIWAPRSAAQERLARRLATILLEERKRWHLQEAETAAPRTRRRA